MDVKEATHTARDYITDVFADEQITNLGLEEVVHDVESEQWRITFGFARPWDRQGDMGVRMGLKAPRAYKVVHVDDSSGRVAALTDRLLPELKAAESAQDDSPTGETPLATNSGEVMDNPSENQSSSEDKWGDVLKLIAKITDTVSCGDYIFRGEAKHFPKVSSGLYRELEKAVKAEYSLADFEKPEIDDAKCYTGEDDDWKLLSHIQHYGGITNLVDFTMDVNVALFFACDGHIREDGRIIILERKCSDALKFHEPKEPTDRAPAQRSILVKPDNGVIESAPPVKVPSELKVPVLKYLNQFYNIDYRSIYEGYHGYIKLRQRYNKAFAHVDKGLKCFGKNEYHSAVKHLSIAIDDLAVLHTFKAINISFGLARAYSARAASYDALDCKDCANKDREESNRLREWLPPNTENLLKIFGNPSCEEAGT